MTTKEALLYIVDFAERYHKELKHLEAFVVPKEFEEARRKVGVALTRDIIDSMEKQ